MRRSTGFVLSPALFETDYNLFLKLIWGCRMMGQAEEHESLGEEMQGSRKHRSTMDVLFKKTLSLICVDNKEQACLFLTMMVQAVMIES